MRSLLKGLSRIHEPRRPARRPWLSVPPSSRRTADAEQVVLGASGSLAALAGTLCVSNSVNLTAPPVNADTGGATRALGVTGTDAVTAGNGSLSSLAGPVTVSNFPLAPSLLLDRDAHVLPPFDRQYSAGCRRAQPRGIGSRSPGRLTGSVSRLSGSDPAAA